MIICRIWLIYSIHRKDTEMIGYIPRTYSAVENICLQRLMKSESCCSLPNRKLPSMMDVLHIPCHLVIKLRQTFREPEAMCCIPNFWTRIQMSAFWQHTGLAFGPWIDLVAAITSGYITITMKQKCHWQRVAIENGLMQGLRLLLPKMHKSSLNVPVTLELLQTISLASPLQSNRTKARRDSGLIWLSSFTYWVYLITWDAAW